jgi:hypothetical protein
MPDHWQTLLAGELPGSRTVPPLERDKLSRASRVEALDREIRAIEGPLILAAHSAGVLTVVHWAQTHSRPIRGALLATPADIETPLPAGYPTPEDLRLGGWLPIPRTRLAFPSIVASSDNDPLASAERTTDLARAWNSLLVPLGPVGHLNPTSGYGPWPRALELLRQLDDVLVS